MKKILGLLFSVIVFISVYAGENTQPIVTKITSVKVFTQGAQVSREASFSYTPGRSEIVLKDLPLNIDTKTIRIKSKGDFNILSVLHRKNYLKSMDNSEEIQKLEAEKNIIGELLSSEERKLAVLKKHESLIQANMPKAESKEEYWTLDELRSLMNYFNEQFEKTSINIYESERKIRDYKEKTALLSKQMTAISSPQTKSVSEVVIQVFAGSTGKGFLEVQYITPNAGWKPSYDMRVQNLTKPLTLSYKAEISQFTGENWDNVKLSLSTRNPYVSDKLQTLQPWYIEPVSKARTKTGTSQVQKPNGIVSGFQKGDITGRITDQYGAPLPGATIVIKGTTTGTVTDLDGRFSIHVDQPGSVLVCSYIGFNGIETEANSPLINFSLAEDLVSLEEVVVIGYGTSSGGSDSPSRQETEPENFVIQDKEDMDENYSELEVKIPYSVPSDGKEYTAILTDLRLESEYVYKCIPKLSRDVFLQAGISGFNKYMLKPGTAGLFYQGTYLGNISMDFRQFSDTLDISFGKEERILVKREKLADTDQAKALSINRTIEKNFRITVRNNKNEEVTLQLQDQYPVATKDYIQSEPVLDNEAVYNDETGLITWNLELKPDEEKVINFGYRIKFPKSKKIIQE